MVSLLVVLAGAAYLDSAFGTPAMVIIKPNAAVHTLTVIAITCATHLVKRVSSSLKPPLATGRSSFNVVAKYIDSL